MREKNDKKNNKNNKNKIKQGAAKDNKEYIIGGYTFTDKQEAQYAKDELNAIKYLSAKTDSNDPKQVYMLYNQIIDRKLFTTLVGLNYLKELQQFLYLSEDVPNDKIRPIPINQDTQIAIDRRREQLEHRSELRDLSIKVANYKNKYTKILIVNVFLVIAIVIMFLMLKTSSNPNIINYEVRIQDKYAQWQEQLESQEASLKAREKQLEQK